MAEIAIPQNKWIEQLVSRPAWLDRDPADDQFIQEFNELAHGLRGIGTRLEFAGEPGSVLFIGSSGLSEEDPDNFYWDDTNNRLGIGTSSPDSPVHIKSSTAGAADYRTTLAVGASDGPGVVFQKARGSIGLEAATQADDFLGAIDFGGHDGTAFRSTAARLISKAGSLWSGTNRETYFSLEGTPASSTTAAEIARITGSEVFRFGGSGTTTTFHPSVTTNITQVFRNSTSVSGILEVGNAATASGVYIASLEFGTSGASASDKRSAVIASQLTALSSTNVTGDLEFHTANGGSPAERMRITADGKVGIRTTSPSALLSCVSEKPQTETMFRFDAIQTAADGVNMQIRKARGTAATPAVVVNDDLMFAFSGQGYDGTSFLDCAQMLFSIDGTPATNNMPGMIVFRTRSGSGAIAEALRIQKTGAVGIRTTTPQNLLGTDVSNNSADGIFQVGGTEVRAILHGTGQSSLYLIDDSGLANEKIFNLLAFGGSGLRLRTLTDAIALNTNIMEFKATGNVGVGETSPGARLHVTTGAAATKGLLVKGAASQSANLQEWQDSAAALLLSVDASGDLVFAEATNVILGTTTGTKIGTATTQKIGFFNKTPVVQPSAYTPTNVTTDRSYDANATTIDELADVVGTIIADLQSLGLVG